MTNPGDMPLSYQILPAVDAAKAEDGGSLDLGDEVGKLKHEISTFSVCFENHVHTMGITNVVTTPSETVQQNTAHEALKA